MVRAGADRDDKPFKFLDATFQVKVSGKDAGLFSIRFARRESALACICIRMAMSGFLSGRVN